MPLRLAAPITLSCEATAGETSMRSVPLAPCVNWPTVSLPTDPPGATVPPKFVTVPSTLPNPWSVPPFTTTLPATLALGLLASPMASVPADTVVKPLYVLIPFSVRLPAPAFVSAPAPLMMPASVASNPLVSTVPPPAPSVTARADVKPAPYCSVPPFNVSPPDVAPRLTSLDTLSVPALTVVPPL